jgi:hypothetical protein
MMIESQSDIPSKKNDQRKIEFFAHYKSGEIESDILINCRV